MTGEEIRMPMVEFKMPANTPRVMRSPFVQSDTAITMPGDHFEDGNPRIFVSVTFPQEAVDALVHALEEQERIQAAADRLRALMSDYRERIDSTYFEWTPPPARGRLATFLADVASWAGDAFRGTLTALRDAPRAYIAAARDLLTDGPAMLVIITLWILWAGFMVTALTNGGGS